MRETRIMKWIALFAAPAKYLHQPLTVCSSGSPFSSAFLRVYAGTLFDPVAIVARRKNDKSILAFLRPFTVADP